MDYIISGKDGVTKGQVAGIAHQEYVDETPTYEPNYATKYKDLITDPDTGEFIAGVQSKESLPLEYQEKIETSEGKEEISLVLDSIALEIAEEKAEEK